MSKGTILIVEDVDSIAQIAKQCIESFGFSVSATPSTGEEAFSEAQENRPDLVLMDIGLPGGMDGIEAARRIRFDLQIPVVFLTGRSDSETLEKAKSAEPLGYVLKPFKVQELQSTIETALHQFNASRKRTEETLMNSEERYRELAESLPLVVFEADINGKIKYANRLAFKWFGYTPEDLEKGLNVFEMLIPADRERARIDFQKALLGNNPPYSEYTARRRDGSSFHCSVNSSLIVRADQLIGLRGVISDITERKLAEEALLQAEAKYRSMFENSIDAVFQITPSGKLLTANQAAADMLGYEFPEDLISQNNEHDCPFFMTSGSWRELKRELDEKGSIRKYEFQARRKDGSTAWLSKNAWVVRNSIGQTLYYEGHADDVTEWKLAQKERKLMEIQLYQAHKLEAIGQLAAGIAHEINTPMQYVGDNLHFLLDAFNGLKSAIELHERLLGSAKSGSLDSNLISEAEAELAAFDIDYLKEEISKAIDQTLEGIERVSTIVGAMKDFSHPGTGEKKATDIHKAIENTLVVCRNEWKYVAEIVTDFDPNMPLVSCVPGDFNQVILNLVVNAAHAIADVVENRSGEKGTITVQTLSNGGFAEIRVTDTGGGIPKEARSKIFEPFFTTKQVGKGTGQGLAIAHSTIVRKHGGSLTFQTGIGRGTTFIIRLPLE
jgi:two-component system NtrC family sensor kinase